MFNWLEYGGPARIIKAHLTQWAQWQKDVMQVMCVLPGGYRYTQVAAACRKADVAPSAISLCLAAQQNTFALQRFYAALGEKGKA